LRPGGVEFNKDYKSSVFGGAASVDTSAVHTYRFECEGDTLDVFVDGSLTRHFESAEPSGGSFTLMFGDLNYLQ
jgi:hypothetical protein